MFRVLLLVLANSPVGPEQSVAPLGAAQRTPGVVALPGGASLLVWCDDGLGPGIRMLPLGPGLTPGPESSLSSSWAATQPAAARSLSATLVAWTEADGGGTEIVGKRVSFDGGVLDAAPLELSFTGGASARRPRLASNGEDWLAVYVRDTGALTEARGVTVSAAGVRTSALLLFAPAGAGDRPDVAFDGVHYVVAWQESRDGGGLDVLGTRVLPDASVLDVPPLQLVVAPNRQWAPSIAAAEGQWLVAWLDQGPPERAFARRFSPAGVPLDAAPLLLGAAVTEGGGSTAVSWDGQRFVVAWTNGAGVDVTHVDPDGGVVPAARWTAGQEPALAFSAPMTGVLTYADGLDASVHFRAVRPQPEGEACLDPLDCGSGHCVVGWCCATACVGSCTTGLCQLDGGVVDAGGPPDAGEPPDAGGPPDAGPTPPRVYQLGCGCGPGSAVPSLGWLLLLALGWGGRRAAAR